MFMGILLSMITNTINMMFRGPCLKTQTRFMFLCVYVCVCVCVSVLFVLDLCSFVFSYLFPG